MKFFQLVWLLLAAAVSFIGCATVGKYLSKNYEKNGDKFMTVFTYFAVFAIFVGGALFFLKSDWFS